MLFLQFHSCLISNLHVHIVGLVKENFPALPLIKIIARSLHYNILLTGEENRFSL